MTRLRYAVLQFMVLVALLASPFATPGSVALAQDATPTPVPAPAVDAESVLPVDEMPEPTVAPDVPPTEAPIAPTFEATVEPTMAPTVETAPDPTPTATVVPTEIPVVQNADTFSLTTPLETPGVATLGDEGKLLLSWDYAVTTDRAGTEIVAEILDENGAPATGWSVTFPATGTGSLVNITHLAAGAVFPIEVLVTGPIDVGSKSAYLTIHSTILDATDSDVKQSGPVQTLTLLVSQAPQSHTDEPHAATPVPRGVGPMSVTGPDGRLSCTNANTGYEVADAIAPGEIIRFDCTYGLGALGVVPVFTARATLDESAYSDGWRISLGSTSLKLLGLVDLLGGQTGWNQQTASFTTLDLVSLPSRVRFEVYLKAPLDMPDGGVTEAPINVETVCASALAVSSSCGSLGIPLKRSVTLTGVMHLTNASSGGGALLNDLLLPDVTRVVGDVLFSLECEDVTASRVLRQGQTVSVPCSMRSLIDLDLLDLVGLEGSIRLSASPGPFTYSIESSYNCPGDLLSLCLGSIADLGLLETGLTFFVVITPLCHTTPPQGPYSVRLDAQYGLRLAGRENLLNLSDGWATVPFAIEEGEVNAPSISINTDSINFGTYHWDGNSYLSTHDTDSFTIGVTISPPTDSCPAPGSTVQIGSTKPLTNGSYTIENTHIGISAEGNNFGWGSSQAISGNLGSTHTIFETSSVDASTAEPVELELNLSLSPPPDAPPGDYEGTITITSYPSGAPGE